MDVWRMEWSSDRGASKPDCQHANDKGQGEHHQMLTSSLG